MTKTHGITTNTYIYEPCYYWRGETWFDYLAELPSYAKILTENPFPIQIVEENSSTGYHINITKSKGENIPQLAERPPNADRRLFIAVNAACHQSKGLKP